MSTAGGEESTVQDRATATAGDARSHVELPVLRACLLVGIAALIASVIGASIDGLDGRFAHQPLRTAIESIVTLVPALAASLFWGRARRTAAQMDVLLASSLAVYAVVNFCFALVPCLLLPDREAFSGWAPSAARFIAVAGFVAAAWLPDTPIAQPRQRIRRVIILALVVVAGLAVVAAVGSSATSAGRISTTPTGDLERDAVSPLTLAVAWQTVVLAAYSVAAVGFMRRALARRDELLAWLAVALTLAAIARFDFLIFPSEWVGDLVRLAAFITLLVGCAQEIASYQRRVAEAAVFRERRRMARDLHDGLAQELAYITVQSRRLAGDSPERRAASDDLVSAAERALEESRLAIAALNRPTHEPLDRSMEDAARSTAARAGIQTHFDVERDVEVAPEVRDALLRVMREAIGNAARHGEAHEVWISLRTDRGLFVRIADNGRGFDPDGPKRPDSMGLESMRERIEALGGKFIIDSAPGTGTRIEIELP
jgi:signal transduction histidine kinase